MSENMAERKFSESSYQNPTLLNWKQKKFCNNQGMRTGQHWRHPRGTNQASARNDPGVIMLLENQETN